ncbi:bifunctional phosphoribosylaminoimidazole carboxylase/phosphoribosylaminoimidazole succinocarboxamide synthetase [Heteronotia binoei]|uniref:bifunctional phosphoribosylaminoimidazole carboxylase/phosphoribosylaminoimidazole succinocarboxamide synthetase n=1 Tax=Heteronotia binoei TaxID=13085 RepID=UPI00292E87A8|nr:bifunctional phosphoribosylaminoimidazole carboxylase/phosphoribosylaminoimidazole succinocarboxamide synthetase [Heteronotia binoei]
MESGAGRHWTEEEVKALLSVWSEKNIRKQLHGTLRNKGIFIYIAKRLQEVGICRDWKQCRAKYKNLKYEYRTVKYAHNSGDATKTMKFFHELDAILQHEPVTQLKEEENSRCSANEIINATRENNEGEALLKDEEDTSANPLLFISHCRPIQLGNTYLCLSPILPDAGNPTAILDTSKTPPFIPSVANEGGKHWTVNEVRALIRVWSDKSIQQQLEGTVRNKRIFEHVAARLQKFGIDRDWKQCRTKYKNLKHEYKSVKNAQYSGNTSKTMKFFRELDAILGHGSADKTNRSENNNRKKPADWTEVKIERNYRDMYRDTGEEDSVSSVSGDLGLTDTQKVADTVLHETLDEDKYVNGHLEQPVIVHMKEDIKEEVIDLEIPDDEEDSTNADGMEFAHIKKESIDIDEDSISTASEDASGFSICKKITEAENQMSLDEAQSHFRVITVNDAGVGKHWCDNEVRALINIWSDEEIQQTLEGATRNKEIFEEIARRLMKVGIDRDWKQCRTKYKNLKYEYRALQKDNSQLGNARRKMRFYDEINCILRSQPLDTVTDAGSLNVKRKASEVEPSPVLFKKSASDNVATQTESVSESMHSVIHSQRTLLERFYKHEEIQDINAIHLRSVLPGVQQPNSKKLASKVSACKAVAFKGDGSFPCAAKTSSPESGPPLRPPLLPVLQAHQPQRDHMGHIQLRGPQAGGDAAEHAALLPDAQLLQLHAARAKHVLLLLLAAACVCGAPKEAEVPQVVLPAAMPPIPAELKLGKKINEGKTKEVYELPSLPGCVLMQSKDQITAGNAARKDIMEGKATISNATTSCVFQLLQESGIKTAFVRKHSNTAFIAAHCEMIPIEWVCRRIATGSFLKRNPGVKEGYRFYPPKIEMFYKDDAANDPQWSEEQLIEAKFRFAGLAIGQTEVDIMAHSTQAIFEILEKAWQPLNCTLVDLKVEFGVDVTTKEIVLADVIDNDSWRLWPSGDRKQQKDKQSYRDLKEVTPEALQMVKKNFEWVAERVELLLKPQTQGRVVVLMGSPSDVDHCEKIKKACGNYSIPCELRVTSAHKGPDETLRIKAEYEGDGVPTIFVAVAGRSNGLGPVMSGNTAYPVVNCPPLSAEWGAQDVWSSLRLPSGLGCSTVLSPEGAAQFAAQILGLNNHFVWAKLRANMLNVWISLKQADKKMRECTS